MGPLERLWFSGLKSFIILTSHVPLHVLEAKIQAFIAASGLLTSDTDVGVALSGGADSVALLAALVARGCNCTALHCNFHLRGEESDRDMHHAVNVCKALGVPVAVRHFDVEAQRRITGESVEMACRTLRYDWFREWGKPVAVAHHREDNIETFMLNLLRSSGIDGLTGMARLNGNIIRPMLDVTRPEIEDYLATKGLGYVVDSSNASNEFRRNRLRNVVLPLLEDNFPGAGNAIAASIEHLKPAALLVEDAVKMWIDSVEGSHDHVNIKRLIGLAGADRARFVIFQWLKADGINATQAADIVRAVSAGRSGQVFELPGGSAVLDRGVLNIHRGEAVNIDAEWTVTLDADINAPVKIEVSRCPIDRFKPGRNPAVIYLDPASLPSTLTIRYPRPGDRFRPFGLKGTKLLSDLFNDLKIPAEQRRRTPLLTDGTNIIWVIGLRPSAHYPITAHTTEYLQLTLQPR